MDYGPFLSNRGAFWAQFCNAKNQLINYRKHIQVAKDIMWDKIFYFLVSLNFKTYVKIYIGRLRSMDMATGLMYPCLTLVDVTLYGHLHFYDIKIYLYSTNTLYI